MRDEVNQTIVISSTDASHSRIGTTTPIDYNLSSIHKNSVVIIDVTVGVSAAGESGDHKSETEVITPVRSEPDRGANIGPNQ